MWTFAGDNAKIRKNMPRIEAWCRPRAQDILDAHSNSDDVQKIEVISRLKPLNPKLLAEVVDLAIGKSGCERFGLLYHYLVIETQFA